LAALIPGWRHPLGAALVGGATFRADLEASLQTAYEPARRYGEVVYAARHAAADPDKPAIIMATSGQIVTYGEYESASNQVAHFLRDSGLRRGDHMSVLMENNPRMLMSEAGAERTGPTTPE
jgi:long-subunit acyl-CoA synthetase (AMP-forming)